jgi:two-component system phosphate regulon sensor histidine kinase PhoR
MALLWSGMGWIVMVLVALVVVSWFSSLALSRRLVRPVLEIDPTLPDGKAPYRELEPLVSKLREQQGQLEGQMRRLRGIDAMRREFTANVTHEFKTPIASILGASELIRDGVVKPEDIRNFAGHIHDDARRLSSLVSDILTLSKLDESERSLDRTVLGSLSPCDLLDIARDVVARLRAKAENAHVTLTFEGKPIVVRGYPRLIDEMIGNLVDNAIRYNESGGSVAVQVGLRDDRPVIRVRDTGIGIPPEDQQKVFERFYRVDKSRSRSHGGTGLGLAIVKHVANIHDTDITLQSTVGVGTTVPLTFPPERYREEKSA